MAQPDDLTSNIKGTSSPFFRVGKGGVVIHSRSSGAPSTPAPTNGDLFFDQDIGVIFYFDQSRSKWLSTESYVIQSGRSGTTGNNGFYRGINGLLLNASRGWPAFFDGTVVGFGYTRGDTDNANFEILAGGSVIETINSQTLSAVFTDLNSDFNQGQILTFRNTGSATSNVQFWTRIKWRSS